MSDLSNRHLGEYDGFELIEVIFSRISIFSKGQCPTIPALCDFVMRANYPRESEVKRVEHVGPGIYRLYVQRDPCPAMLLPGQTICPLCGEEHD